MCKNHLWINQAIQKINADFQRSADTHLIHLPLPQFEDIDIYLKDESTHPSGSLKHRLARSLFLYALCNGWIGPDTPVIEASSGSTAVSEAYFAKLIGVPFIAVMPSCTAQSKMDKIKFYGGQIHLVERTDQIYSASRHLAKELNGHYMDQFTYAERATDWRGNNNIANSIFEQMRHEKHPTPHAIVMSAGTGGTSATIGRFIRYQQYSTVLHVVDPEHSVFHQYFKTHDNSLTINQGSRIEGIGRPRVEPSFISGVIDTMQTVKDAQSIVTMRWLSEQLGRKVGPSTGTNMVGVLNIATQMRHNNQQGSIVTLLCDSGERYLDSYYSSEWVTENIGDLSQAQQTLNQWLNI